MYRYERIMLAFRGLEGPSGLRMFGVPTENAGILGSCADFFMDDDIYQRTYSVYRYLWYDQIFLQEVRTNPFQITR